MSNTEDNVPDEDGASKQRGIQSVEQAIDLLSIFIGSASPLSLKVIADKAGMAMSSTHRYLVSLRRSGLVCQDELTGLYDVGPKALQLGLAFMRRVDAFGATENAARRLAMETGQTTFVSIWTESGPAIVRWFHGDTIIITTASIGTVLPIFRSSTGRVFAAYFPEAMFDKLAAAEKTYTRAEMVEQRASIHDIGYAWITELITPGLFAVAAPVRDILGNAAAVITLLGTDESLVQFPNTATAALLRETSSASLQIGFQPAG